MALTNKQMGQPITQTTEIAPLIYFLVGCVSALIGWVYFINAYFKNKKDEKREWIEQIASASVNAAMDTCLKPIRDDINILFKYREDDRKHIDHKFDMMVTEIRK